MWNFCLILGLLALPAGAQNEIKPGTHVLLRMINSITTRTAQPGDQVYLRTASPISDGSRIIVPESSYVQGVVAHARRSGRASGRAQLGIRLETLTLPGGKVLRFTPRLSSVDAGNSGQKVGGSENQIKQGSDAGRDAATVAILAGSGASIGGIADRSWKGAGIGAGAGAEVGLATVMLSRGREVELRQGATIDVVFDRALKLE